MELKVKYASPGLADGFYQVQASGCAVALLSWADEKGALEDWTAFAYIPVDACGKGGFCFRGGRAIPPAATHIHVRAAAEDLTHFEEKLFPIPHTQKMRPIGQGQCFALMSDLHLSAKPGLARHVFAGARNADALLLAGDITNDGTWEQFELLKECFQDTLFNEPLVQDKVSGMKVFPVIGNHDRMACSSRNEEYELTDYYARFQEWIFDKMKLGGACLRENTGKADGYEQGPDGAYSVRLGKVEIIGLQAVTGQRKFLFEEGRQLIWLDQHLSRAKDIRWHLILCHAPLLHHNPKQKVGRANPYLNRDRQLQEIIDRHGNVFFLSGHTHLSMNHPDGCVEWDAEHRNLYINDGSVRPTDLLSGEMIQPKEWKEGARLDITICDEEVEIVTRAVKNGKKHARGYYHFDMSRMVNG